MDFLIRLLRSLCDSLRAPFIASPVVLDLTGRSAIRCDYCALRGRDFPGRAAHDLDRALRLELSERRARHARLLEVVSRTTAITWASDFLAALTAAPGAS